MVQFKSLGLLFFYLQFIHQYLVFDDCSPKYGYDAIRDKKTDTNQGQKMQTPKPGQHTKVEIRFLKRFVSVRNMILIL